MKIIFDSEEQKEALSYSLIKGFCPSELYLKNYYTRSKLGCSGDCERCWKESGLEMEVRDDKMD